MNPLFFKVVEAPDRAAFDPYWVELPLEPFVVDRSVVGTAEVSRSRERCVLLRPDLAERCWELRNRAPGRLLIAYSGERRHELQCDESVLLRERTWTATLVEAFSFAMSSRRPHGIVRGPQAADAAVDPAATRRRRGRDERAAAWLGRHRDKRLVLAYQWRQHLGHTTDVAEDLDPALVGRKFGQSAAAVGAYRIALAKEVFGEGGHQHAIRDVVVHGGLLTWADVMEADRELGRDDDS